MVRIAQHVFPSHRARTVRWALGLLLPALLLASAHAAVRMDVFLGYDGILPEASWFPVTFEIANDGPAFNAVLELAPGQSDRSQTHTLKVELPTGTTKRFVMPVFASGRFTHTWDARLRDERGKVRAESTALQARKFNPWSVPLLAAVTRTPPVFPEAKTRQADSQPAVARIPATLFPDHPITLEGLDTVYVSSEKALEFKVGQVNALLAWLHAGGHLVIGVEQSLQVNGNEWLSRILPCQLTGMSAAPDPGALQAWVTADRQPNELGLPSRAVASAGMWSARRQGGAAPDAPNPFARLTPDPAFEPAPLQMATASLRDGLVLIGSRERPLAVTAQRGRGQLTVLLFSPELEPFLSWKNRPYFWAKLAGLPPELFTTENTARYGGQSSDGIFGAIIDSKQVRKLPVGWLLLLLGGYLVVIGPLDYYGLKKVNRQMLTWITFPCYVALFSVLIYFIGYKLRAGETEWNELSVVDVLPVGVEQADLRGRTYASVYSPANATYRLASELPFAALRGEYLGSYAGQEGSRATVEQRGNNFAAEIAVPVWTSQLYVHDWWQRGEAPVKVEVSRDGAGWQVTVENRLKQKLGPAQLIIGGQVLELGVVPADETKTIHPARTGVPLAEFVRQYGQALSSAVAQRRRTFGENRSYIGDIPRAVMAVSFVGQLGTQPEPGRSSPFITPPGLELSGLLERGGAIFLAWAPDLAPVKPLNQFSPRRLHRDTLWRLWVNVGKD